MNSVAFMLLIHICFITIAGAVLASTNGPINDAIKDVMIDFVIQRKWNHIIFFAEKDSKHLFRQMSFLFIKCVCIPTTLNVNLSSYLLSSIGIKDDLANLIVFGGVKYQIHLIEEAHQFGMFGKRFTWLFVRNKNEWTNEIMKSQQIKYGLMMNTFILTKILETKTQRNLFMVLKLINTYGNLSRTSMDDPEVKLMQVSTKQAANPKYYPFNGLELKIGTFHGPPYVELDPIGPAPTLRGYSVEIIKHLSQSLGFRFQVVIEKSNSFGGLKDGKWTGLVGQVHRKVRRDVGVGVELMAGDEYLSSKFNYDSDFPMNLKSRKVRRDVGVGVELMAGDEYLSSKFNYDSDFPMNLKSRKEVDVGALGLAMTQVVDYSSYMHMTHIVTVIRRPTESQTCSYSIYTKPFSLVEWLMIAAGCSLVLGCISVARSSAVSQTTEQELSGSYDLVLHLLGIFVQIGSSECKKVSVHPRKRSVKTILLVFTFYAILVYKHYCTFLTASLTVKAGPTLYNDLDELIDDGKFGITVLAHTSAYEELKNAKSGVLRRIWNKIKSDPASVVRSNTIGFQKALFEDYVYLPAEVFAIPWMKKANCSLIFLKQRYLRMPMHFIFPKNSPLTEIFSVAMLRMRSNGILRRLEDKFLPNFDPNMCKSKPSTTIPLRQTIGAYVLLCGGILLSVMFLLCEIMVNKRLKRVHDNCMHLEYTTLYYRDKRRRIQL